MKTIKPNETALSKTKRKLQKGSISLLGALGIFTGIGAMTATLELGDRMIKQAQFNSHAKAIAPIAMRAEMVLTKAMVDKGEVDKAYTLSREFLDKLGLTEEEVSLTLTFGNIVYLDSPKSMKDAQGNVVQSTEEFIALSEHADNPKKGLKSNEMPPKFNAVAVQIKLNEPDLFINFIPTGRAVYGLSDQQESSPEIGGCYCDVRFNACMQADKNEDFSSIMGEKDTDERRQYCETGFAPSDSGGFFGAFFGGKAIYDKANMVKLSPQWIGRPYLGEEGGSPTNENSVAWKDVLEDQPLKVENGNNPFPEAGWDAENAKWLFPGASKLTYEKKTWFGSKTEDVEGTFYMGRSGTCAYPSSGFFFFKLMDLASDFLKGNTDCLRYTANPGVKYEWTSFLLPFMNLINGVTGTNEHYYSCYDFSGIQSSRNGLQQVVRRIWTNPLQDWTKSYQQSDCTVKTMHHYGFWIFGGWK